MQQQRIDRINQAMRRARESIARHEPEQARQALDQLLRECPDNVDARTLLSGVLLALGQLQSASEQLVKAVPHLPDDLRMIAKLAHFLYLAGDTVNARRCLERAVVDKGTDGHGLMAVGFIAQMMGDTRRALGWMERAAAAGEDSVQTHYYLGLLYEFVGRFDDARRHYDACLVRDGGFGHAMLRLARLPGHGGTSGHIDVIRMALRGMASSDTSLNKACLQFALYEELEARGDYPAAWPALEEACRTMRVRMPCDAREDARLVDAIVSGYRLPPAGAIERTETPLPIFIIGLPRSGTSLLERILGRHSQVTAAGELAEFFRELRWMTNVHGHTVLDQEVLRRTARLDYAQLGQRYLEQTRWRAGGAAWFVDKFPLNYQLAGIIHGALPRARILHLVRDARDVCFSNYRAMFSDTCAYSYGQQTMAACYLQYRRVMAHWHDTMPGVILDVSYRDLVTAPEATVRRVLEHCGLPFEPACLDPDRGDGAVATLSSAQVREPIHARAFDRWQPYATGLLPMFEALGAAVD